MTTYELPPEPEIGTRVRAAGGEEFYRRDDGSWNSFGGSWGWLVADFGPLTLIEPDPKCGAHLNLHGEDFQCDLTPDHFGLGHSNVDAQAVWGPVPSVPLAEWERELLEASETPEPDPWPTAPLIVADWTSGGQQGGRGLLYRETDADQYWTIRENESVYPEHAGDALTNVVSVTVVPTAEWEALATEGRRRDPWPSRMTLADLAAELVIATDALGLD